MAQLHSDQASLEECFDQAKVLIYQVEEMPGYIMQIGSYAELARDNGAPGLATESTLCWRKASFPRW
jgi:hypothetical protein